jgi:hypothetical protein
MIFISSSSSSSSSSSVFTRDFFFLKFLIFFWVNHVEFVVFHSVSRSKMNCNNSTNMKIWFFVIFFICLIRAFFAFRVVIFLTWMSFFFHFLKLHELSINSLFFHFTFFLKLCSYDLIRILLRQFQIVWWSS